MSDLQERSAFKIQVCILFTIATWIIRLPRKRYVMEINLQSLKVSDDMFSEVIFVTTFFALHKVHVLSKTRLDVLFTFEP